MDFELPNAKRIRREDLGASSPRSDRSSSVTSDGDGNAAEIQARLAAHFSSAYDSIETGNGSLAQPADSPEKVQDELVSFRLFASDKPAQVAIKNDNQGENEEGKLLHPRAPNWYLWNGEQAAKVSHEAQDIAVSGETIRRCGDERWRYKGLKLPWRVVNVVVTSSSKHKRSVGTMLTTEGADKMPPKRKRPGKKKRIATRQAAMKLTEKETREREKRARKNKQRTLKRRAKAEAKKANQTSDKADRG